VRLRRGIHATERASAKTIRLALRWMLILATACLLAPPGFQIRLQSFETALIVAFALSNVALTLLPAAHFRSRNLEFLIVIGDTFLVSLGLFRSGLEGGDLPIAFFLNLLLAALGRDLPRIMAGATLVSGFYLYLTRRQGDAGSLELTSLLLRIPFLYMVALYYGHLVIQARLEQDRSRQMERKTYELRTLHEIASATTSTLDLKEVLYVIVQHIARLVNALRCSILTVDERGGRCTILASSDDPAVAGLTLDSAKYPEIRRAMETHQPVVIDDISREPMMDQMRGALEKLGFQSIMVLPILFRDDLLGMLFLRAARSAKGFTSEEVTACRIVANASANAIRNAKLFEQAQTVSRSHKEAADKLQNILDHFPDLIYTTDLEGRITEFSRGGEALLGLRRSAALGKNCADLYTDPEARERLRRLLREGRPLQSFETDVRCADGPPRQVMVAAALMRDESGVPYGTVGIIKDIADVRAARKHLVQAEKLSAMGELVSGVAHELNNPLAGVLGYSQLLMRGPMEPRQQKAIDRIFESALRCQKIVQNLLAFARRYPSEKRHLGLNGIVEKTLDLKEYQLRVNNVKVVKRLDPDLPKTMLDFNQIQQVLLNVINNAQQAMASHRGQGTLTITTSTRDGRILLEISDDGPGIPGDLLGKIFDPFFTTKPVGEGTGLGLSVSYGIVKDHGGRISADSAIGQGATISIDVPILSEGSIPAIADPAPRGTTPAGGKGRALSILAVDDEAVILDLIVDAFGRDGHRVDTAAGAREALEKIEKGSYDILLLDLKMPEMDGRDLFQTIRTRWPALSRRVIFASGDTLHPDTQRFIEQSGCRCVDKPFKLEVLAGAIASLAGESDPLEASAGGA
jgi:PAS domain S-box-containing protein